MEKLNMKVISIGTDRKIFEKGSAVRERMIEYGKLFEELHVLVFSRIKLGLLPEKISNNVWIYPTNSKTKLSYIKNAYKLAINITQQKKNEDYYITAQDPFECGVAAWLVSRKSKIKLQLQIHTDLFSFYFKNFSFLNRLRVLIAKILLPEADSIRVVSNRIKDSLKFLKLKREPFVLPVLISLKNGGYDENLKQKYSNYDFVLLTVSRLSSEKNIGFALKIFCDVLSKRPKGALVIVGDGPEMEKLRKEAEFLGINKNVFFEGWQDDLSRYYQIANMFLFTSLYEGYGLVLVESASYGCPVISSDVGLIGDILKKDESALVCDLNDKKCFVDNILKLIDNKELHEKIKINGQRLALKASIGKDDYLKLFKETFI
jgi:glycosyltransferase involved in cell wall biosynthesis